MSESPVRATAVPTNKVVAATGGATVGSAAAVVLVYILDGLFGAMGVTLPAEVKSAVGVIFTAAATGAAGYMTPPSAGEAVVKAEDGSVRSGVRVA